MKGQLHISLGTSCKTRTAGQSTLLPKSYQHQRLHDLFKLWLWPPWDPWVCVCVCVWVRSWRWIRVWLWSVWGLYSLSDESVFLDGLTGNQKPRQMSQIPQGRSGAAFVSFWCLFVCIWVFFTLELIQGELPLLHTPARTHTHTHTPFWQVDLSVAVSTIATKIIEGDDAAVWAVPVLSFLSLSWTGPGEWIWEFHG